jgi:hypothetical protein
MPRPCDFEILTMRVWLPPGLAFETWETTYPHGRGTSGDKKGALVLFILAVATYMVIDWIEKSVPRWPPHLFGHVVPPVVY